MSKSNSAIEWTGLPQGVVFGGEVRNNITEDYKPDSDSSRLDHENLPNGCFEYAFGAYVKIDANTSSNEEIGMFLGGGSHQGGSLENRKRGRSYVVGIRNTGEKIRVRKEFPHPKYHGTGINKTINIGNVRNKWIGVIGAKINENNNVRLMVWVDTTAPSNIDNPPNSWTLVLDVTDSGNWEIDRADNTPSEITDEQIEEPWLTPFDTSSPGTCTIRADDQPRSMEHRFEFFKEIKHSS